ncbi:MAG TPA: winged helix-turn-helix domain-containing protein [Candidatus Paceibacterota bacterium]|nr:winged helix-turn-helix domain-containing protein [Candidatus Paceibacterota bacterium]
MAHEAILKYGDLVIDKVTRTVTKEGIKLQLPLKELELLVYFVARAFTGNEFSSQEMIKKFLYGANFSLGSNVIAVYISNMKKKLREAQSIVQIEAWRTVGYRLVIVPVETAPNSSCE